MKKLVNDPRRVVREMLEGVCDLQPGLALLADFDVVARADLPSPERRAVAVISGGGSGHEPAHAGYVGPGLLAAAIAGDVFTSPSVDAVVEAIRAVAGKPGAVLIVKNYMGDRLNFGLAAEMARAEGIPVEVVVVADDVALPESEHTAGPRGIAGTVLVHKVAGASAEAGASLAEVAAEARAAASLVKTMGVALSPLRTRAPSVFHCRKVAQYQERYLCVLAADQSTSTLMPRYASPEKALHGLPQRPCQGHVLAARAR